MPSSRSAYHRRVMGATVVVLVLAILLVQRWPAWTESDEDARFRDRPADRIQVRDVQPTNQSQEKRPPPPAPVPPVVVPNEVLLETELEFGESELHVERPEDDAELQEGADRAAAAQTPDQGAQLLKNVQPPYPSAARREDVRARIQVEVHITETGRVEEATIRRRWRVSSDGSSRPVQTLGYGLEDAAITAAQRSLFRPARAGGRPVATRTMLTFTFGRD